MPPHSLLTQLEYTANVWNCVGILEGGLFKSDFCPLGM